MESNRRSLIARMLGNRRTLIIVSVLIALLTWLSVSLTRSPETERVVRNVPVSIDNSVPSQLGYKAFGAEDAHVDVTVSGQRYEIGDNVLSADDLVVTAVTTYVDAPGRYTLTLIATPKNADAGYTIISKSQDTIDVYFDTPKSVDVTVTPVVSHPGDLVDPDRFLTTDPILSKEKVTVSGPTAEVDKLETVRAAVSVDSDLRHSVTEDATVSFLDGSGKKLKYLSMNEDSLTITVPVYRKTELPVGVGFTNVPSAYYVDNPLEVSIRPETMAVAVDPDKLRGMDEIRLGDIDFSKLEPGINTFTYKASDITDGVALNEDDVYTVVVDAGDLTAETFAVSTENLKLTGVPDGMSYTLETEELTLTLVGPEEELEKLDPAEFQLEADVSDLDPDDADSFRVPVTLDLGNQYCWVYGTPRVRLTRNP